MSGMKTKDFDFYCDNERFSVNHASVAKGLRDYGFWYDEDMGGKSILYNKNNDSVEFLASYSREGKGLANLKAIGIKAERLPYLDIYKTHNISTGGLLVYGDIRIPTPAAYVMHKIIINDERSPEKQKKDEKAIKELLNHFRPEDMKELKDIYNELGKKTRKRLNRNAVEIGIDTDLFDKRQNERINSAPTFPDFSLLKKKNGCPPSLSFPLFFFFSLLLPCK